MSRFIILTQRPIEGIETITSTLSTLPAILFKVNARVIKVDSDFDDLRPLQMFIQLAHMFGMYAYMYDRHNTELLDQPLNRNRLQVATHYGDGIYFLGGTCHADLSLVSATVTVEYGRMVTMKNGFSQIIGYDQYQYIRYHGADGRCTTTIMNVDSYLTNTELKNTFTCMFGVTSEVVHFQLTNMLPAF